MAKHEIPEVTMDLTPMIDCVFLLLIFFMVSMKFRVLEGKLVTELPKDRGVNAGEIIDVLEKLEIDIKKDPSREYGLAVYINSQLQQNLSTFEARLRDLKLQSPDQKATLYPQIGVNYEQVVKVVDSCLSANLTDITFAGVVKDA